MFEEKNWFGLEVFVVVVKINPEEIEAKRKEEEVATKAATGSGSSGIT